MNPNSPLSFEVVVSRGGVWSGFSAVIGAPRTGRPSSSLIVPATRMTCAVGRGGEHANNEHRGEQQPVMTGKV